MRPYEHGGRPQHRVVAGANLLDPVTDEARFGWDDRVEGRARIEQKRPVGGKSQHGAELLPRPRRHAAEPLVVALRAGDDEALRGDSMEFGGFAVPVCRSTPARDRAAH